MTQSRQRLARWVFYGGLGLLLLLIVTGVLAAIIPAGLASRVAYNSEGYLFALVLGGWMQFGLTRMKGRRRLQTALALGALCAVVGLGLLVSDLPSRVRTLNEPALALALLVPYVSVRRPLPRWSLLSVPAMLALIVWGVTRSPDGMVVDLAETFGFLVLTVITLDVIDRALLDRNEASPRWWLWAWYGFMVLEPVFVSALGTGIRGDQGAIPMTLQFLGRIHESFIGVLLVVLVLRLAPVRRTGRPASRPVDETPPR